MAVSQVRICCWVWLSLVESASHCSCREAARSRRTAQSLFGCTSSAVRTIQNTVGLLPQSCRQSGLADVLHELEQVLPALPSEAGLHVTQEGQVLLPGVGLREQVLKSLAQRQQELPVVHWLVPAEQNAVRLRF